MRRVIHVDFKKKRRIPVRNGFTSIDDIHIEDGFAYMGRLYFAGDRSLEDIHADNMRRMKEVSALLEGLTGE